jgi:hypothetical protein
MTIVYSSTSRRKALRGRGQRNFENGRVARHSHVHDSLLSRTSGFRSGRDFVKLTRINAAAVSTSHSAN